MNNLENRLNSLEERIKLIEKNKESVPEKITVNNNLRNELWKSDIINEEDKKIMNNWFNLNNDKTIKLLYKASRDGDAYQDFYKKCEDKGPTITIALTTKGYKFGGFTSLSWKIHIVGRVVINIMKIKTFLFFHKMRKRNITQK